MITRFYRRDGSRVSRAHVAKQRDAFVEAKGTTGRLGDLTVSIQPTVAASVAKMTEEQFADFSGGYTFRRTK